MPNQFRNLVVCNKGRIDITVYNTIIVGLTTSTSIIEGKHPAVIIKDLSTELKKVDTTGTNDSFKTFGKIIPLVAFISESFRDTHGADDYWVNISKISQLTKDDVLLRIYLGLLYQQIKLDSIENNIELVKGFTLLNLLDIIGKNWSQFSVETKNLFSNLTDQINLTQSSVSLFKETKKRVFANDELTNRERNYEMFNAYINITTSMLNIIRSMGSSIIKLAAKVDNSVLNSINISDINTINKILKSINTIFSDDTLRNINTSLIEKIEAIQKIGIYIFNKQYAGAVAQTFLLLNTTLKNITLKNFIQYGTFMANMVTADSPEAITEAIEAVAAPPGSYSIKNNSGFSIALNGYLGLFGGGELFSSMEDAWNISIAAPVGISFNWDRSKCCIIPHGLFISIIDLGVITNYRLSQTEDVTSIPKVQLMNLFSTGLFFEWRFGDTPLTFAIGGQFGPQIREKINKDDNGNIIGKELINESLYFRFGGSLKIDIPILYFKY